MATNRYTQLTPAKFNPLSVEEIMMVPMARQKQHEAQQAGAYETGQFDVNRLDVDDELINQGIQNIQNKITGIENELYEKGTSRNLTRKLINLRRERDKFLSNDGQGGKAKAAYDGFNANVKNIRANSNATPQEQAEQIAYAQRRYAQSGGVGKGASYQAYDGFDTVDVNEELIKYGDKLKPQILKTSGWSWDEENNLWRKGTNKTTQLPLEAIQKALAATGMSNQKIVNYLKEKQRVNPNFNPVESLVNSITSVSDIFVQNDREYDSDIRFRDSRDGSTIDDEDASNFSLDVKEVAIPQLENLLDMEFINDVQTNKGEPNFEAWKKNYESSGNARFNPAGIEIKKAQMKQEKELWEQKKERFFEMGKKLLGHKLDKNNIEDMNKVKAYAQKYKGKIGNTTVSVMDPTKQSIAGMVEGDTPNTAKLKTSMNSLYNTAGTKFIANGKYYNSKEDLLKGLGASDDEGKDLTVAGGVVDWDNGLYMTLPKGAEHMKTEFVQPYAGSVSIGGKSVEVYMSRKDKDMAMDPIIKRANNFLHDKVNSMKLAPDVYDEVEIINENDEIETIPIKYDPYNKTYFSYDINTETNQMEMFHISKEELQNHTYSIYKDKAKSSRDRAYTTKSKK